jgi:hypothetical protein
LAPPPFKGKFFPLAPFGLAVFFKGPFWSLAPFGLGGKKFPTPLVWLFFGWGHFFPHHLSTGTFCSNKRVCQLLTERRVAYGSLSIIDNGADSKGWLGTFCSPAPFKGTFCSLATF